MSLLLPNLAPTEQHEVGALLAAFLDCFLGEGVPALSFCNLVLGLDGILDVEMNRVPATKPLITEVKLAVAKLVMWRKLPTW